MDDVARHNKERWEELAQANIVFSRPYLNLNASSAREAVDPHAILSEIRGRSVLCLANGGGQQSVALALLGAEVTVLDLSETQLERDREAARHYGVHVTAVQGDMRDLSRFGDGSFDVVYQAYSINFVPSVRPVFAEVTRVLRPGGLYYLQWHNPFAQPLDESDWDVDPGDGSNVRVVGPREFRHTLSAVVNGLIARGFVMLGMWESADGDADAEPGTWEHFMAICPPYLELWATLQGDPVSE